LVWDLLDNDWGANLEYREVNIDLGAFEIYDDIRVAWRYTGKGGQSFALDEVKISGWIDEPWVTEAYHQITLPADSMLPLNLFFNSTDLLEGVYETNLQVAETPSITHSVPISLFVGSDLKITSAARTNFIVNQNNAFSITTDGIPTTQLPRTITFEGELPDNILFQDNHDGTAQISGVPSDSEQGTHLLTIRVSDDAGREVEQTFTLVIGEQGAFQVFLPIIIH
jgi:hypothetical protein